MRNFKQKEETLGVNFTWHATKRLRERSIMRPEELIDIIEKDRFIVVGCEGRKQYRQHLLFYSISDDLYMVAVYDVHSKSVITILPTEYHSVLTKELLDKAYSLSGIEPIPSRGDGVNNILAEDWDHCPREKKQAPVLTGSMYEILDEATEMMSEYIDVAFTKKDLRNMLEVFANKVKKLK